MHIARHPRKRQTDSSLTALPEVSLAGVSGIVTQTALAATETALALDTSVGVGASYSAPPIIGNGNTPTVTAVQSSPSTFSSSASPSSTASSSSSSGSSIPLGTVIGACVGAFAGLGLLLCLFLWCGKRPDEPKPRGGARRTSAYMRNAQGGQEQQRARSENWRKLDGDQEDKWDGMPSPGQDTSEMEEKNFSMFKKSPSIYSKRTIPSDDDHGILPPFEFSKYHPHLAEELSLAPPSRPFTGRQDSGVSWDGETVGDDSFLSLRSVRVESGTMSPTMINVKTTPAAMSTPFHKWESAEVLTMEEQDMAGAAEVQNPFADAQDQRRSVSNPFFNAQDMHRRTPRSRSNSNSTTGRYSRSQSMVRSRSNSYANATMSQRFSNPFADIQDLPVTHVTPPEPAMTYGHGHNGSVASGHSGNLFGQHAMRSLIAALDLSQEEVEERLRVVSMQGSILSDISSMSGVSGMDDDTTTVREFPMPPANAHFVG
ncbi:hypothetical protein B0H21DRAFT_46106 [Amylocystis lapponica]|nr:hypothetical protein B0H21DRAFT_46106 [Amylocystis lapponica]